jgi:FkbM family methyltransferase
MKKAHHPYLEVEGLHLDGLENNIEEIHTLYAEFFNRVVYEWWYEVQEGDVVVDIGSCIGLFSRLALNRGASKVYAIEPNPTLIETTTRNCFDHICNQKESKIVPINAFMGTDTSNGFGIFDKTKIPTLSFKQFIKQYEIDHIDYLKIDCEGGEYDILTTENLGWIKQNVKHIVVEIHIGTVPNSKLRFKKFRDEFLYEFEDYKIRFNKDVAQEKTYSDKWLSSYEEGEWGGSWMIYICNKSLEHRKNDSGAHLHGQRNG